MNEPWFLEQLVSVGSIDRRLADLIGRFVSSADTEEAARLASAIELAVAPPNGLLRAGVGGVVDAVVAGLPLMEVSIRWHGAALLGQIGGSFFYAKRGAHDDSVRRLVGCLPSLAALAQVGDSDFLSEFVDFAAICAALDPSVAERVTFYLRRIVEEIGGDVGAGAQTELDQLGAP